MLAWVLNNHRYVDGVQLCVIYLTIVKMHIVSTVINGRRCVVITFQGVSGVSDLSRGHK